MRIQRHQVPGGGRLRGHPILPLRSAEDEGRTGSRRGGILIQGPSHSPTVASDIDGQRSNAPSNDWRIISYSSKLILTLLGVGRSLQWERMEGTGTIRGHFNGLAQRTLRVGAFRSTKRCQKVFNMCLDIEWDSRVCRRPMKMYIVFKQKQAFYNMLMLFMVHAA